MSKQFSVIMKRRETIERRRAILKWLLISLTLIVGLLLFAGGAWFFGWGDNTFPPATIAAPVTLTSGAIVTQAVPATMTGAPAVTMTMVMTPTVTMTPTVALPIERSPSPSVTRLVGTPTLTEVIATATQAAQESAPPSCHTGLDSKHYSMSAITGPSLIPLPGAAISSAGDTLEAVWQVTNNGICPWLVRFEAIEDDVPSLPMSGPVWPGATARVVMRVSAGEMAQVSQVSWAWQPYLQTTSGDWLETEARLKFVLDEPWVRLGEPASP